ncbi:peptidylprolyl isomerase [Methylococcus geothermalis]|uniref:peptidylprolyl isomerase n=1 Tax=Methylococcus geothermalis TaxID=2681310 RepID=A0A858QBM6_9GAMM|nr:peptidylprolyl isomerase [Methylococcus geothermalis]QJD31200.1 peptidylprolyl isomerase [Methylococcus geothermalis]
MQQVKRSVVAVLGLVMLCGFSVASMAKPEAAAKKESATERPVAGEHVAPAQPVKVVMLKVDGEEITVQDYVNFLQRNQSYIATSMTPAGQAEALRAMVSSQLLRGDMVRKGLLPKDPEKAKAALNKAYEKLAEEHFPLPPPPDEKAAYQFYLDHQNEYGIPEMVRVSQIQFRFPEKASEEQKMQVRKRADEVLKRLDAGEPFAKLAGELTENPRAKVTQGDLGFMAREGDPWLSAAIKNLKVGEHTQVVESSVGFEILKLTDIRPSLVSPYPNVREKVIQRMRLEGQAKQRDAYVRELAKHAKIEVVQDELKTLFPRGVFP